MARGRCRVQNSPTINHGEGIPIRKCPHSLSGNGSQSSEELHTSVPRKQHHNGVARDPMYKLICGAVVSYENIKVAMPYTPVCYIFDFSRHQVFPGLIIGRFLNDGWRSVPMKTKYFSRIFFGHNMLISS